MKEFRFKDVLWTVPTLNEGKSVEIPACQLAVLMDLRDELKFLNRLLNYENLSTIVRLLREIKRSRCHRKHKFFKKDITQ